MAYAPADPRNKHNEPMSGNAHPVGHTEAADSPPPPHWTGEHPRIIEEHHVVGPHGADQLEATDEQGRRWYQLRPEPRRRADFIGFNYTWWLVIFVIFMFLIMSVGHRGWGN